ncbi:MAG TPA: fumarylacetoacetate hydrolase family protein [Chthoniobacterales bacterium]
MKRVQSCVAQRALREGINELDEAYGVQAEVTRLRVLAGEAIAGYKIGCIGPKIRQTFGMSGPIRGVLFKTELRPSGSTVHASRHACLAIEGEMAVQLGNQAQVVGAFPVIELHNYVFRARPPSLSELVANNGLHAGVILPEREDIMEHLVGVRSGKLEVSINDKPADAGPLWSLPGGWKEAVAWLQSHLRNYGLSLQAGHLILTGTALGLHPVGPGDHIRVVAEGVGGVEATVSA